MRFSPLGLRHVREDILPDMGASLSTCFLKTDIFVASGLRVFIPTGYATSMAFFPIFCTILVLAMGYLFFYWPDVGAGFIEGGF